MLHMQMSESYRNLFSIDHPRRAKARGQARLKNQNSKYGNLFSNNHIMLSKFPFWVAHSNVCKSYENLFFNTPKRVLKHGKKAR
jgi:hypothetical protein